LDTNKWEAMLGTGTSYGLPAGWGNNERQYYQAENATVADGLLTITAKEEAVSGSSYTSSRLRTLGMGDWTYGRIEMRAKMPIGQGLWPAFWMLPTDTRYGGWAASGEIDITEYLGHEPSRVHGTIHFGSQWPNSSSSGASYDLPGGTFHDDFHVFAIEWQRGEIRWYIDDVHYETKTEWFSTAGPFPAPFDVDFHILLNLAVGGNWPGAPDSTTSFPQELVVDYVRVYQSAVAKGTQASTTALLHDKTIKMKKLAAQLVMSFENQARKKDTAQSRRQLSCVVSTEGKKGALTAKGQLHLEISGTRAGAIWTSSRLSAPLDRQGKAGFSADDMKTLVDEAAGNGVITQRLVVVYDGAGGKKVTQTELDCWQRPG
jgi:beta-glucanase (GH16 family)